MQKKQFISLLEWIIYINKVNKARVYKMLYRYVVIDPGGISNPPPPFEVHFPRRIIFWVYNQKIYIFKAFSPRFYAIFVLIRWKITGINKSRLGKKKVVKMRIFFNQD